MPLSRGFFGRDSKLFCLVWALGIASPDTLLTSQLSERDQESQTSGADPEFWRGPEFRRIPEPVIAERGGRRGDICDPKSVLSMFFL